MAIYHFSASVVGKGESKGQTRSQRSMNYINREKEFAYKNDLIFSETNNLPEEFKDIDEFLEAAEKNLRENANVLRKYEVSLPVEFDNKKNIEIAKKFCEKEFSKDYIYSFAVHNPHGVNPHMHISVYERKIDGIVRETKEEYFKRANSMKPEKGGWKKDRKFENKKYLYTIRKNYADHVNEYLREVGIKEISEKSLKDQAKDKTIEIENKKDLEPKNYSKKAYRKKTAKEIKRDLIDITKKIESNKKESDKANYQIRNAKNTALNIISKGEYSKLQKELSQLRKSRTYYKKKEKENPIDLEIKKKSKEVYDKIFDKSMQKNFIEEKFKDSEKKTEIQKEIESKYEIKKKSLEAERKKLFVIQKMIIENAPKKQLNKLLRDEIRNKKNQSFNLKLLKEKLQTNKGIKRNQKVSNSKRIIDRKLKSINTTKKINEKARATFKKLVHGVSEKKKRNSFRLNTNFKEIQRRNLDDKDIDF